MYKLWLPLLVLAGSGPFGCGVGWAGGLEAMVVRPQALLQPQLQPQPPILQPLQAMVAPEAGIQGTSPTTTTPTVLVAMALASLGSSATSQLVAMNTAAPAASSQLLAMNAPTALLGLKKTPDLVAMTDLPKKQITGLVAITVPVSMATIVDGGAPDININTAQNTVAPSAVVTTAPEAGSMAERLAWALPPAISTYSTQFARVIEPLGNAQANNLAIGASQGVDAGAGGGAALATGLLREGSATAAADEILLAYALDGQPMGGADDLLSARQAEDGTVYLPLQALVASVGFPIAYDSGRGVASGWFVNESRSFKLDIERGQVTLNGVTKLLPAGSVRLEAGELFVAEAVLNEWFPVKFNTSLGELALNAQSTETLPLAARLARQNLWASRARGQEALAGPRQELQRLQVGWPDVRLSMGLAAGNEISSTQNYGVGLVGPLAGMDSFLNLSFAEGGNGRQGLTGGHFRLSRYEPSATLLGALQARSLELGDVSIPNIALLGNASTGQGVAFSNAKDGFIGGLNDFVLEGAAPVGWDVEVYRNGGLQTFATVASNGRYRFPGLSLGSGVNDFKIVLYGPQGQKEERNQSFRVGEGLVGGGEFVYEVGALATTQPLIQPTGSGNAGGSTVVLKGYYGLTDKLALSLGAAQGPLGSKRESTAGGNAGLRLSLGPTFSQLDVAQLADGSTGFDARTSWRVLDDLDIGAFITRQASSTLNVGQTETVYGATLGDTFNVGKTPVRYGLAYSETRYAANPNPQQRLTSTQGWQLGPAYFTNQLGWVRRNDEVKFEGGTLDFTTRLGAVPVRGALSYQPSANPWLTSAGLSSQLRLDEKSTLNLAANLEPASGRSSYSANVQRAVGPVNVGLNTSYNSQKAVQVGVNLGVALVNTGGEKPRYTLANNNTEGFGYASAEVQVFADENNNGTPDAGEDVFPEVTLTNLRNANKFTTNAQGVTRLTTLLPNADNPIQIDESTLPDLYLRPVNPVTLLAARTGYGGRVALPLVRMGEVGGIISGLPETAYAKVGLSLINSQGETVQRTTTDMTGGFNFAPLPLGTYTLEASHAGGKTVSLPLSLTRAQPLLDNLQVNFGP